VARGRWRADAPEDPDSARERLIDAAEDCFARFGVAKTTVEDVASAAGISRATIYRYFDGGRDELILAVLMREAGKFLGRLDRRLDRQRSFADALVEGVVYTLREIRAEPQLALLFAPETAGHTGSIAGASEALFHATTEFLTPVLETAQRNGDMREDIGIADAAEWVLRTILSMLTVQGPRRRSDARLRDYLHAFLVPALAAR
jgi:AcrR family transcriptional regulator